MENIAVEVQRGTYYDSIVLMQLQQFLGGLPGVMDAGVFMGTPTNKEILAQTGLLVKQASEAEPEDLIIVVKAQTKEQAKNALEKIPIFFERTRKISEQEYSPRSIETALSMLPSAKWVVISVPGRYAWDVAWDALKANCHVFLYSDNVSLQEEISLKQLALKKGLLVMGPDCGTAIVGGIGLGFANQVRKGPIGLVAASGTGLQIVTSRIHQLGSGISHAIGTGGRDLKTEIGAITTQQALRLLQNDRDTKVIVLISKPPSPRVAQRLLYLCEEIGKPVVVAFLGYRVSTTEEKSSVYFVDSLEQAAFQAVKLTQLYQPTFHSISTDLPFASQQRYVRGLFSGGTLAYETLIFLSKYLSNIYSNIPLENIQKLDNIALSQEHTILDLGADEFTVGRLHPMMDQEIRIRRLKQEAQDPQTAIILLDVVLGYGSHPDPASELAPAIAQAHESAKHAGRHLEIVVILVGTEEDPQGLTKQEKILTKAGARVEMSSEAAICYVLHLVRSLDSQGLPRLDPKILNTPFAAINVGLQSFAESLESQGASVIHLDWRPPAGGNEKLLGVLRRLKKMEVEQL